MHGGDERSDGSACIAIGSPPSETQQNVLPEIQQKLSGIQSKLDVLVGWQEKIFVALHAIPHATEGRTSRSKDKHVSVAAALFRPMNEVLSPTSSPPRALSFESAKEEPRPETPTSRHQLKLREYVKSATSERPLSSYKSKPATMLMPISISLEDVSRSDSRRKTFFSRAHELFPLMPNSKIALSLDLASMTFLFYDSIMVPFMLAWGTKMEGYFLWSALIVAIFWTADMCLQFVRAYIKDGKIVDEYRWICCHYVKRRFLLDILVVTVDWFSIIFEILEDQLSETQKNIILIKYVRVMKVTRLFRMHSLMRSSRYVAIKEVLVRRAELFGLDVHAVFLAVIMRLIVMILWLGHISSCAWIGIVNSSFIDHDTERTWENTIAEMHGGSSFSEAGLSQGFLYALSVYWSLTAMFSGGSFLVPMTTAESIFSSLYVLFGFLVVSSMISSMATNLIAGHQANYEKKHKLQRLQQYLLQRDVDPWLSSQISRQLRERLSYQRRVVEDDVPLLKLISADLREVLQIQLWTPPFALQPIWRACMHLDGQIINNFIRSATESFTTDPGDIVFEANTAMEKIFFLLHGSMQYTLHMVRIWDGGDSTGEPMGASKSLQQKDGQRGYTRSGTRSLLEDDGHQKLMIFPSRPICEMALWVEWDTVGLLEAMEHNELLAVRVDDFVKIVDASSARVKNVLKAYAFALVGCIEHENPAGLTDLVSVDHDAIVPLMPQEDRVNMSLPALKALKQAGHLGCSNLQDEITAGKCNLGQDKTGKIVRAVKLAVLSLEREDGSICVGLGERSIVGNQGNEAQVVSVNLPGVKLKSQETVTTAMDRILFKCFAGDIPEIAVDHFKTDIEEKPSAAYGIPTKYIRTTCHARITTPDFIQRGTKDIPWSHGRATCFSKDSSIGRTDSGDFTERVFAWMTKAEYDVLADMGDSAEDLVRSWMQNLARNGVNTVQTQGDGDADPLVRGLPPAPSIGISVSAMLSL